MRAPDIQHALRRILLLAMTTAPAALAACSSHANHADAGAADRCQGRILDASITDTDAGSECYAYERYACGLPPGVEPVDAGCGLAFSDCEKLCRGFGAFECHTDDASCVDGAVVDSGVTLMCSFCSGSGGRRPRGLSADEPRRAASALADYFARAAHLEAASVPAFRNLARSLRRLGAPRELSTLARRAAREEVRHARLMRRLAARHGGRPAPVHIAAHGDPDFETLAIDNAVEGMVRETLGALVANWQARHARDAATRAALGELAADETRHAALAWRIARWADPRLDARARRRVSRAGSRAIADLQRDVAEPHPTLVDIAGLPPAAAQRALLAGLERELWSLL